MQAQSHHGMRFFVQEEAIILHPSGCPIEAESRDRPAIRHSDHEAPWALFLFYKGFPPQHATYPVFCKRMR